MTEGRGLLQVPIKPVWVRVSRHELGSSRKREPQLRECFQKTGLWASLERVVLVNDGCEKVWPTVDSPRLYKKVYLSKPLMRLVSCVPRASASDTALGFLL